MNQAMATAMAMTAMAAMTATTACEPEGACDVDRDCAFGQMCGVEGQCVYAPMNAAPGDDVGFGPGDPMLGGADSWSPLGDTLSTFSMPGTFDGTIGGTRVDRAEVSGSAHVDGMTATLQAAGTTSTFVVVQLPWSAFATPGTTVWATNMELTWGQACNYDTSSYDESFGEVVVDVSPPRAPAPDDQIVAEDTPVEVVDVVVSVDGEGSSVAGAFTMPLFGAVGP